MDHKIALYELALGRVLDYLARHDVEVTPAMLRCALELLEEALAQGEEGLLPRVFDALPRCFEPPLFIISDAAPPLHRRSVGYG